jgi:hypothetical protein
MRRATVLTLALAAACGRESSSAAPGEAVAFPTRPTASAAPARNRTATTGPAAAAAGVASATSATQGSADRAATAAPAVTTAPAGTAPAGGGATTTAGAVGRTLFRFDDAAAAAGWRTVNDPVMGGLSESSVAWVGGALEFSGTVSLENNGGFAALIRRGTDDDLTGANSLRIVAAGDGKTYQFRLRSSGSANIVYVQRFTASADGTPAVLPIGGFEATDNFGQALPSAPPLDPSSITEYGILIADGQAGAFRLRVLAIEAR